MSSKRSIVWENLKMTPPFRYQRTWLRAWPAAFPLLPLEKINYSTTPRLIRFAIAQCWLKHCWWGRGEAAGDGTGIHHMHMEPRASIDSVIRGTGGASPWVQPSKTGNSIEREIARSSGDCCVERWRRVSSSVSTRRSAGIHCVRRTQSGAVLRRAKPRRAHGQNGIS